MKKLCLSCLLLVLLDAATCFAQSTVTNLSDLAYKKIAVPKGTVADELVLGVFPNAQIVYYENILDCAVAVKAGLVQAAAYDEAVLHTILRTNSDLLLLPDLITKDNYAFAVNLGETGLKASIDACIDELEDAGAFKAMAEEWFAAGTFSGLTKSMHNAPNGVLRFGTCARLEPFAFKVEAGQVIGFDIELAFYVAQKLGMRLEVYDMPFEALLPALLKGDVDVIGAGLTVTEERAGKALFSKPYYQGGIAVLVKK